jgi:endogenous inhibitor of DNA gyrase (YacG/DUF329 family)
VNFSETGLPVDEEGRAVGFMFTREARIADWRFRKEREAFDRLCAVLRVRKWVAENPERRRRNAREHARRVRADPERREELNARERARRAARPPRTLKCKQCGAEFPWKPKGGQRPHYCSDRCGQRFRYLEKTAEKRKTAPELVECRQCGTSFERSKHGNRPKYCSTRCRNRANRRRR